MNMDQVYRIIDNKVKVLGYFVSFDIVDGNLLRGEEFPGYHPAFYQNEPLIKNKDVAMFIMNKFAKKTVGKCVNIYLYEVFINIRGKEESKSISEVIENR